MQTQKKASAFPGSTTKTFEKNSSRPAQNVMRPDELIRMLDYLSFLLFRHAIHLETVSDVPGSSGQLSQYQWIIPALVSILIMHETFS